MQSKEIKRGERKSSSTCRMVKGLPGKVTFELRSEGSQELSCADIWGKVHFR